MFVATKASTFKGIDANSYQIVTFRNKRKEINGFTCKETQFGLGVKKKSSVNGVGDMKKLRYEIIKFGTSGFSGRQKEDANVALMVSLGAEPPKRKARNYKEILTEKKTEKGKIEGQGDKYKSLTLPRKRIGHATLKKRKKDLKGLLNIYGEVNKNKYTKKEESMSSRNKEHLFKQQS